MVRSLRVSELERRPLDSWPEPSGSGHTGPVFLLGASPGKGAPRSAGLWGAPERPSWAGEVPQFASWLSPQGSGHNVSQEALAIKRMLEIGAVKNLTFF